MVESVEHRKWSSYLITVGINPCLVWFDRKWILGSFGSIEKAAIKHYMQFVANGVQQPSPWGLLKNQIYLGSDEFVDKVQAHIADKKIAEIPSIQKRPVPKPLESYGLLVASRNEAIWLAYRSGGYTMDAISRYFSLHYSTVSRIIQHAKIKT